MEFHISNMDSLKFDHDHENNSHIITNPLDPQEFRRNGHLVIDFIADYYQNIEKYQVLSQVEPGYLRKLLPESAPYHAEPIEIILQDVQKYIMPGITHWQSPNYFAYFPSSGSVAGFLGEMLSTGFNVVGFNWMSSPAATELECIVMDWLGEMLKLPKSFLFSGNGGGVLQGTTCEAILCTLTAARDQMLSQFGRDKIGNLVVYGSDQTHSALQKAAQIAGIYPKNFRAIKTTKSTLYGLCPNSLRATIQSDVQAGLVPLFLCATVGTTSTNAIDPIGPLCEVAKDFGIWVHIDAAYAGSAFICPEFRHFIDGIEGANSFTLNAHKWFFTTLDCCCLWVKDPSALIKSLSTNAEFLRNKASDSKQVVDYKDWQITLSRRFRAMKLWLVLRNYGVANLRNFLRSHVKMAKLFEELVGLDNRFEVIAPRNFALVCFRVLPSPKGMDGYEEGEAKQVERANELNKKLLESINGSGKVYMSPTVVDGAYIIRCAIGATLTEERHVIMAWKIVKEHAATLLSKY
ncbi:tyrosine decarboxylase 1-like [Quercus lobata]|uniref:Tyrosine decarboxylase n=1 Tax=Quercus lobata TaxID=97700 RepID=A0A7N2R539_QUELO|nr:tyrosine decarboxylase 1-like [Quercus lobata]